MGEGGPSQGQESQDPGQRNPKGSGNCQWSPVSHWKETNRTKVKGTPRAKEKRKLGRGVEDKMFVELRHRQFKG